MVDMKIKAVLFDMDGVLIDACDWHFEAFNRAISLFGYGVTQHEHETIFDGLPTKQKLEILSRTRDFPQELHNFVNTLKQRYTMEIVHHQCFPIFSHEYALARLKDDGYKIALCSNSIRQSVEIMLNRANIKQRFDVVLSNEDVSAPKPDPEIYLMAMNKLDVRPNQCLIIEDNENGIAAAVESGANVLRVSNPQEVSYELVCNRIEHINQQRES